MPYLRLGRLNNYEDVNCTHFEKYNPFESKVSTFAVEFKKQILKLKCKIKEEEKKDKKFLKEKKEVKGHLSLRYRDLLNYRN